MTVGVVCVPRTRTLAEGCDGWGQLLGPGASSWPPPARLAPPGTQGPFCSTDNPSLPAGPSSLTHCVLRAQPRLPGPLQSPRCGPSLPFPWPHSCCRSQSCGLLTPGWAWKAPSAASFSCPPCSASSGPFSVLPGPLCTPIAVPACSPPSPSHHELPEPGAVSWLLRVAWAQHQRRLAE